MCWTRFRRWPLADRGATKGRSVGEMFAHLHNVWLMWLQAAAPALYATLTQYDKAKSNDGDLLKAALNASADAIAAMLAEAVHTGKAKGFKPHPDAFVGHLIGHEHYDLGEIGVALQQSGHALDTKTAFGTLEWGRRSADG
jgi:uncharacterized damage-inducible protein DinB